jgi:hypothetical protein
VFSYSGLSSSPSTLDDTCYIRAQKFETFPTLLAGFTPIASGRSLSGSHDFVVLFSRPTPSRVSGFHAMKDAMKDY